MIRAHFILENRYFDSIVLMEISGRLAKLDGVADASVMTGSPGNLDLLRDTGFLDDFAGIRPADLVCCLKMTRDVTGQAKAALDAFLEESSSRKAGQAADDDYEPRTLESSIQALPGANLLLLSIPGAHVRYEAKRAISEGLHVMIFSDNVPLEDEVELKTYARSRGLLVMGPDCGTAILNGAALGFANAVARGPVGVVGASGTGIQEVTCLIDRFGGGVSHAIGTGGRDLKKEVGGISMLSGLELLDGDPATRVILLLSKPPDRAVAERVLERARRSAKPVVVCFLGERFPSAGNLHGARTLEEAARAACALAEGRAPDARIPAFSDPSAAARVRELLAGPFAASPFRAVRGLYSGGTLYSEAKMLFKEAGLPVTASAGEAADLRRGTGLPDGHVLLDLGDDEFTVGRPHPMIDSSLRAQFIRAAGEDPRVSLILLDVVLGYGSNADPAGSLADAIAHARDAASRRGDPLVVAAAVTGTATDPQPRPAQEEKLRAIGVELLPTAAEAARFSAALASGGKAYLD